MTRQNTRTIRVHNLHLVIRNFRGKALVPAHSKMYGPASSVTVLNYRVRNHNSRVSFASFVTGAGSCGAALGVPASAIQRASFMRTKALAHLFHTPAQNGHSSPCSLPGGKERMASGLEWLNGSSINVFIWRTENRTVGHSKASGGLDWRRAE